METGIFLPFFHTVGTYVRTVRMLLSQWDWLILSMLGFVLDASLDGFVKEKSRKSFVFVVGSS